MINWWAVAVSAVFNMFLGFLWYGPFFGKVWLKLVGKRPEEVGGGGIATYLPSILGAVGSAIVLAVVISFLRVYTWWSGMAWGSLLWFAFGGTALLTTGAFEDRRPALSWLFIGYMVVVHAAEGALFAVWR